MRIIFVNRYFHPDESATAQLLTDLAVGLADRDYQVHVLCSRQLYGDPGARLASRGTFRGVIVHRLWTTRFGRGGLSGRAADYASFYAACAMALTRLARTGDIVVAMTDPPLISLVAAAVAWCKGARLINWLQDIFPEVASRLGVNPLPPLLDRGLRRLRDASLRAAEMNVVLGSHMMEFVCARGVPRSRCRVIANWADAEAVQPRPAAQSALRRRLQLAGKFVVGYSGNLGRAHEYETVLGAAEVMRADIDTAFLFGGGGIKMQALRTEVRQRHLQNFVFLPYQARQELGDSLAAADVHLASLIPALEGVIVPSKFYGILAAGRPAVFVGDPDGELARIIDAARCGVVVPVGDVSRLVEALRGLRADAARRRAMGSAARLLALSRYSSHRAIESWVTLLDEFHVATVSESCEDGRLKR